jgi:hypothetical protein
VLEDAVNCVVEMAMNGVDARENMNPKVLETAIMTLDSIATPSPHNLVDVLRAGQKHEYTDDEEEEEEEEEI